MNHWFTSDTHFNHPATVGKLGRREFATFEEHDAHILDRINTLVGVRDTLYLLGDFAWTKAQKFRGLIRCKQVKFIIGNHDRKQDSLRAFGTCHDILKIRNFGANHEKAVLCHYPIAYWDQCHRGAYHFYGHMHQNREETLNEIWPGRRSMDIGVDNATVLLGDYQPFSKEQLLELLKGRASHDPVEFYKQRRGE